MIALALIFATISYALSASAGLCDSLILVPSLCLLLGAKEGIALAALLLACNNVAEVVVCRKNIRLKPVIWILRFTVLGTMIGASLLVAAPEPCTKLDDNHRNEGDQNGYEKKGSQSEIHHCSKLHSPGKQGT